MTKSAGLLLWRDAGGRVEVLIAHPGGPFWKNKDDGAWSIPKGEYADDEDPLSAARREFAEELGIPAPDALYRSLGTVTQRSGKEVAAWGVEGDVDPATVVSNTFETEWPPRSGRTAVFPEVDRVAWVDPPTARRKLNAAQTVFVDRLLDSMRVCP